MTVPYAVFVSGGGTNLQALLDDREAHGGAARVALVVSNVPDAFALTRAARAGVPTAVIDHRPFGKGPEARRAHERAVLAALDAAGLTPDRAFIVLAGYMRVLTEVLVAPWAGRIINLHPALLPAFKGAHGIADAWAYGVKVTGVTTHFVDAELDHGPIIQQAAVDVADCRDEAEVAARIHAVEHRLLPQTVRLVAEGRTRIEGRRVVVT